MWKSWFSHSADSIPFYLSFFLCAPPTPPHPLSNFQAGMSGPSRAVGLSGVMDDDQPSAVSHYAPGRFTGSLTTRHENQSLSHSYLPSSIYACLAPSIFSPSISISSQLPKRAFIIERCVRNNIEICTRTVGSKYSYGGLSRLCCRGNNTVKRVGWSLTAFLLQLHHLTLLPAYAHATYDHPSVFPSC